MTEQVSAQSHSGPDRAGTLIHATAEVSERAQIGAGTRIWNQAQVREDTVIGDECILGKDVYIDFGVRIGNRCKLQNGVYVFHGFDLEDGVFLGPRAMLLNDLAPRAMNADGTIKSDADWVVSKGLVRSGASVGGGAIILPGVTIGRFAMIGAGAVVTADVIDYGLVYGNPARLHGFVCACGRRLAADESTCPVCGRTPDIPNAARRQVVPS